MLHSTEHLPSPDTPASLHHSSRREISSLPCTQPPRGSPLPSNKIPAPCWTLKTCGLGPCSLSDSPPVSPPAPSAPATPASSPSPHKPGCFLPGGLCCSPFHKLSCGWPWHSGLRSDVTCTERPAQAPPALESPHAHAFYLLFNSQQRLGSSLLFCFSNSSGSFWEQGLPIVCPAVSRDSSLHSTNDTFQVVGAHRGGRGGEEEGGICHRLSSGQGPSPRGILAPSGPGLPTHTDVHTHTDTHTDVVSQPLLSRCP